MAAKRRRKKTNAFSGFLAFVGVCLVLGLVLYLFVFRVRTINVSGSSTLTRDEVIAHSGIRYGSSMFSVSAKKVGKSMEENGNLLLTGMSRKWPATVNITVDERRGELMVISGATFIVLDGEMHVLSSGYDKPQGETIRVTGLDVISYREGERLTAGETRLAKAQEIYAILREIGAAHMIREIDVSDLNNITLTSSREVTVFLGDGDGLRDKLLWAQGALNDLMSRGEKGGRIDVTSGNKADYKPK